jgi:hypothetical protein
MILCLALEHKDFLTGFLPKLLKTYICFKSIIHFELIFIMSRSMFIFCSCEDET